MADLVTVLTSIGGGAGITTVVKALTVDRRKAGRDELEVLEERLRTYRADYDSVDQRLEDCRERERKQQEQIDELRRQVRRLLAGTEAP